MSWTESYAAFARYNRWMNEKLYAAAADFSDEIRKKDLGAFFQSVHGTLQHIVLADLVWLGRFSQDPAFWRTIDPSGKPFHVKTMAEGQALYDDFDAMRAQRSKIDRAIESWVGGLTPERLDAPFPHTNMAGEKFEHPLWWALQHFFNHQTHHRGQATTLLMQLGKDPGVTDYVQFLRLEAVGKA